MISSPGKENPVCYSETELRIIRAFFTYITIEVGTENGNAALLFKLHHPEHNLTVSIPLEYDGELTTANHALEKMARRLLS